MIQITDEKKCCGCSACVQACPKQCISFNEDSKGFRYPNVDLNLCVDCHLCEKVCPCQNQGEPHKPLQVWAAVNPNEEIREKSSSGGFFTALAELVIELKGVVFGARFDKKWEVTHDYTEVKEGLEVLRGSKYLQSRIGDTYRQAKEFLLEGRIVMYSGTSCQIAGLKKYLRKKYSNLLTVDVVCHGVPSPLVWRSYLEHLKSDKFEISKVNFRSKSSGWTKFSLLVEGKSKSDEKTETLVQEQYPINDYMQFFLKDYSLRPSCYDCPARCGKSNSDITIADYWGITEFHPDLNDNKGTSLVLVNTEIGHSFVETMPITKDLSRYENGLKGNPPLETSVAYNQNVSLFWNHFALYGMSRNAAFFKKVKPSILDKIIRRIKTVFK